MSTGWRGAGVEDPASRPMLWSGKLDLSKCRANREEKATEQRDLPKSRCRNRLGHVLGPPLPGSKGQSVLTSAFQTSCRLFRPIWHEKTPW